MRTKCPSWRSVVLGAEQRSFGVARAALGPEVDEAAELARHHAGALIGGVEAEVNAGVQVVASMRQWWRECVASGGAGCATTNAWLILNRASFLKRDRRDAAPARSPRSEMSKVSSIAETEPGMVVADAHPKCRFFAVSMRSRVKRLCDGPCGSSLV